MAVARVDESAAADVAAARHGPANGAGRRLTGRRSCPECGEIYNIYSKPPQVEGVCDFHSNAVLEHRADDYEEKVNVRLDTYDQQTKPLLEYYKKSGRLKKVVGTGEVETIYAEVEKLLGL